MYYQCLVLPKGHRDSDNVRVAVQGRADHVSIKTLDCSADVGCLVDTVMELQGLPLPIVLTGDIIVAYGEGAAAGLLLHIHENPHTHWEASDGESCI
jgi:hypothetical protein